MYLSLLFCSYFVVLCFCFIVVLFLLLFCCLCIFIFVCTSVGLLPPGESPIAVRNNNNNGENKKTSNIQIYINFDYYTNNSVLKIQARPISRPLPTQNNKVDINHTLSGIRTRNASVQAIRGHFRLGTAPAVTCPFSYFAAHA